MKAALADPIESPATPSSVNPRRLRRGLLETLFALSLANLVLIAAWYPLLDEANHAYFNKLPVTTATLLALATNLGWLTLLAWVLTIASRKLRKSAACLLLNLLFFLTLLFPIDFCRLHFFHIADHQIIRMAVRYWFVAPILLALLVWRHRWIARALTALILILSPLSLFTVVRILLLVTGCRHLDQPGPSPALAETLPVRSGQPRVLWLIFDETDQRLLFEQRPPTASVPAFERLRAEALYATNAWPPADSTLFSMPALLSGRVLSNVVSLNNSDLAANLADDGRAVRWSGLSSVFDEAHDLHVNSAVVGWYHPYPRVVGRSLNYGSWYPSPLIELGRAETFPDAMAAQIRCLSGTISIRSAFIELCQASLADALRTVTNENYGLILLHLPPPHKPGVYLPAEDRFTSFGMPKTAGYFNNLVLADRWLGKIRRAMESSGSWERAWVILSADHSWRESALYDGRRDLRVPFLVKSPGISQGSCYSARLNTILTHDLILEILRGGVADGQAVVSWLEQHRSERPTLGQQTTE